MTSLYSIRDYIYDDQDPEMVSWRRREGEQRIESFFEKFPWEDSAMFARRSAPAAVFLQNGRSDKPVPERIVRKSFEYFQNPKRLEFYDAGHELNRAARLDRGKWLEQRLKLKNLDFKALDSIPPLR